MRRVSARVRANRLNGKKGRGPKTIEGKTRSARNALKHGLARPLLITPGASERVEELAHSWVGPDAEPIQLEQARRAAEAQVALERIESRRFAILSGPWVREVRKSSRATLKEAKTWLDIQYKIDLVLQKSNPTERDVTRVERLLDERKSFMLTPMVQDVKMEFDEVAAELLKFDYYERRARSRLKKALRTLDRLMAQARRAGA
jgi:hypothetical protein